MRVKLSAFVISGAITAMIGAVWFYYIDQVEPQTGFDPLFDLTLVLMAFLGGYGSISGAGARRADHRAADALAEHPARVQRRLAQRDPARRRSSSSSCSSCRAGIIPTGGELITRFRTRGRPAVAPATTIGPARSRAGPVRRSAAGQLRRCPVTALLRTEGIMKAYGGVQALNGATIAVEEGTVAGLIGPNGSGKTTLFNVITGYERPDAGEVWFGDRAITNLAPDKVFAAGIGRTFQLTRIFPRLTVHREHAGRGAGQGPAEEPAVLVRPGRLDPPPQARDRAARVRRHRAARGRAGRARSPTASASCSSSPTCWSPTRRSSCSTSRPAG